jgi:hypothetical protein
MGVCQLFLWVLRKPKVGKQLFACVVFVLLVVKLVFHAQSSSPLAEFSKWKDSRLVAFPTLADRLSNLSRFRQRVKYVPRAYQHEGVTKPDLNSLYMEELAIVYSWANGTSSKYSKLRLAACRKLYGTRSARCSAKWRLERGRDSGEILFSLRSIAKNMPWFRGHIYIVTATGEGPEGLDYSNDRLHIVHQNSIMHPSNIPSFTNDCQEFYFNRIPGLKDRFIVLDDDMFIGRLAPPSVFLTQFGGPNLFVEEDLIKNAGICPCDPQMVWRCSVCHTWQLFKNRFGESSVPFHYMKHAPRVYSRAVIDYIHGVPEFQKSIVDHGCRTPFRSESLVQFDFLHHHVLMQTHLHDFGLATGWNDDMHLILLEGKNAKSWEAFTKGWSVPGQAPLFFTINDEGWDNCEIGDILHRFLKQIFPFPSPFEKPGAVDHLTLSHCKYK